MHRFFALTGLSVSVIFFLCLFPVRSFSQSYGEIGVFAGGSYYVGDLNPGKHFTLVKPAFGGFIRHNFNERIAIKGAVSLGKVAGDDAVSKYNIERNLNFTSNVTDISATFEINFFEYFIGSLRHYLTPYMFGGAGAFLFNPKGVYEGNTYTLQPMGTEGQNSDQYPDRDPYNRAAFHIPFGVGVKYSLNDFIGISAYWSMHKTFTDYLDDVSTTYYIDMIDASADDIPIEGLLSDPTLSHNAGMQRGNSQNNDWYSFAGVSVSLKINYLTSKKCLNTFL